MVNGHLALDECFETGVERMIERQIVNKLDIKHFDFSQVFDLLNYLLVGGTGFEPVTPAVCRRVSLPIYL